MQLLGQRYRDSGVEDVTVTVYPGARHEILNETNRDEVTRDLELEMIPVETPIQMMDAPTIKGKKLVFAPILRAGLGLVEGMLDLLPDVSVVLKGTTIDFPNEDKVFHNVFSLSKAARFDLGPQPTNKLIGVVGKSGTDRNPIAEVSHTRFVGWPGNERITFLANSITRLGL